MRKQVAAKLTTSLVLLFASSGLVASNGFGAVQDSSRQADAPQADSARPSGQVPAQPGQERRRESGERAFGSVSSVGVDRLEIKKMDGTAQTVMVDDQTRYIEGGRETQKKIGLEDLKPGDRVFVQGKANDDKEFLASVVRRVTDQDMQRFSGDRAGGEIISINGNQIKVRNPWQGERTVVVNEQTKFIKNGQPINLRDLKTGDRIFAEGQESNGQFVATRVMTGQFRRGGGRSRAQPHDNQ